MHVLLQPLCSRGASLGACADRPGDEHLALDSVVAAPELPRKRARSAENVWSMGSVVMGSAYTAHMECGVGATRRSRLKF